jgi:hypothetical protein
MCTINSWSPTLSVLNAFGYSFCIGWIILCFGTSTCIANTVLTTITCPIYLFPHISSQHFMFFAFEFGLIDPKEFRALQKPCDRLYEEFTRKSDKKK